MGKYLITTGDFLKNAGIVGLYYILKEYKFDVIGQTRTGGGSDAVRRAARTAV